MKKLLVVLALACLSWAHIAEAQTASPFSADFLFDIAREKVPECEVRHKFGHNAAVGTTLEDIWDGGAILFLASSAATLTLSSSDVDDTSAGAGARTIELMGLDGDYLEIGETLALDGQDGVSTVNQYLRLPRMRIITAGVSGWNEGDIYAGTGTITAGVPAVVYAQIGPTYNQTLTTVDTVPAFKTAYIWEISGSSSSQKASELSIKVRPLGEVFQSLDHIHFFQDAISKLYISPHKIEAKSDIKMQARVDAGATEMSGSIAMIWCTEG